MRSSRQHIDALQVIWGKVFSFATQKSKDVPRLSLFVGCDVITQERHSSKRAFCHVGHYSGKVCTVLDLVTVPVNYIVGIYLHEIGHCVSSNVWGSLSEKDADLAVLKFLGVNLQYKSNLTLEWVPDSVVREVLDVPVKIARRKTLRTTYRHS